MNIQTLEKFHQAETEQNELNQLKLKYQEAKDRAEDLESKFNILKVQHQKTTQRAGDLGSKNVELQQKNGSLNPSKEERLQVEETHELLVVEYDTLVTEHQELLENYQKTKERVEFLESKQVELLDNYQAVQLQLQTATQSQAALAVDQNESNERRPKELEETTVNAAVSLALATQAKKVLNVNIPQNDKVLIKIFCRL